MSDSYRKELVQVAAVCAAMAQVSLTDTTSLDATNEGVAGRFALERFVSDIRDERKAQELKWGARNSREAPPELWLLILMEEVGEVAEEMNAQEPERVEILNEIVALGNRCRGLLERLGG